jgi:DNA-binding transcriptional MerR regulator
LVLGLPELSKSQIQAEVRMIKRPIQVPAKLFRIGELVRHTPFSRQTIHNYTIMGLIKESEWSEGGHRLYDESVFSRLSHILKLKETKTLSQIRTILLSQD